MAVAARQPVSTWLLWFSRIMCWLCWAGIASAFLFPILNWLGVIPTSTEPRGPDVLIYTTVSLDNFTPDGPPPPELTRDLFYQATRIVPVLLTAWALVSARNVFANIGRGEFFARSTSLNLRNMSLAVLLNMTAAPFLTAIAHIAFGLRMQAAGRHGEFNVNLAITNTTFLILVFAATVAIIASVMAHAARVAEENEQFV